MNYPLRLAAEWMAVVATLLLARWLGPASWLPAILILGSRQMAMGELGHMAVHLRRPWLAFLAFFPLGIGAGRYKAFHFAHHRHLGNAALDPEVAVQARWRERWLCLRWRDLALDALGLHAWEAAFTISRVSGPAVGAALSVVTVALAWVWPIVLLWPAAALSGFLFVHRLRSFTEHQHLTNPGTTLVTSSQPALWRRLLYLPHGTWRHFEHHHPKAAGQGP